MHLQEIDRWQHRHVFETDRLAHGERRTRWVVALTVTMMVAEIAAGTVFRSMALLADGWHMGTHAAALGIALFAYAHMRTHAADPWYTFGTGKVGALGGFASAVALAVVALLVFGESAVRIASPVRIHFDEAIGVAILGLAVNLACAFLLRGGEHEHGHAARGRDSSGEGTPGATRIPHRDHNLRAAYLHVLADATTSVFAIVALLSGKLLGWNWLDPLMGIAGSLLIARWSYGLLRDTSAVLLDAEVSPERREAIRAAIEADGDSRVADLHVWRVGPHHLSAIVSIVASAPKSPDAYKTLLARFDDLAHITVEVHRCASSSGEA